ncbi:hypothetical protein G113_17742, partial [Aeromonas molluscorum 848]
MHPRFAKILDQLPTSLRDVVTPDVLGDDLPLASAKTRLQ